MSATQVDTKTAGSVTLLMQIALPVMLFGPRACCVTLKGGTDVTASPPIDFFLHVLKPTLERHFRLHIAVDVVRRGFYPKGGGEVRLRVEPLAAAPLPALLLLERGAVVRVEGEVYCGRDDRPDVALALMARAAHEALAASPGTVRQAPCA